MFLNVQVEGVCELILFLAGDIFLRPPEEEITEAIEDPSFVSNEDYRLMYKVLIF